MTDAEARHRMVGRKPVPRPFRDGGRRRPGRPGYAEDSRRRDPRPLRRPGHRRGGLAGAIPADDRGPGHIPPDDRDAQGPADQVRARLEPVRPLLRLRRLRGRRGSLLGALACAGVPERDRRAAFGDGPARGGARCEGGGVGAPVPPCRHDRAVQPGSAPLASGLVRSLPAPERPRGRGSRQSRRLREAVPDRAPSRAAPGVRLGGPGCRRGDRIIEPGRRRSRDRTGWGRIHGALARLPDGAGRHPPGGLGRYSGRHADHGRRCGRGHTSAPRCGAGSRT